MSVVNKICELIHSQLFMLTLTIGVYVITSWIYKKNRNALLHPLLTATIIIALFLTATGIEYEVYYEGNSIINFMLGVSIVSLGYLLHSKFSYIKDHLPRILVSVFIGSVVGVVSVILLGKLFGIDEQIIISLQPKSVTAPIAVVLSERSGGDISVTILAVVATGIIGSVLGPKLLKLLKVADPVAKGLALGSASHAVGTAKAVEMGAVEGAVGGAAIGIMGFFTAILVPLLEWIFY